MMLMGGGGQNCLRQSTSNDCVGNITQKTVPNCKNKSVKHVKTRLEQGFLKAKNFRKDDFMNRRKQSAVLSKSSKLRCSDSRRRILSAIKTVERERMRMTVSTVADLAGVTRATIYNHPDLKALILRKKAEQNKTTHRLGQRRDREVKEMQKLRKRIRDLEFQVQKERSWIEFLENGSRFSDDDF